MHTFCGWSLGPLLAAESGADVAWDRCGASQVEVADHVRRGRVQADRGGGEPPLPPGEGLVRPERVLRRAARAALQRVPPQAEEVSGAPPLLAQQLPPAAPALVRDPVTDPTALLDAQDHQGDSRRDRVQAVPDEEGDDGREVQADSGHGRRARARRRLGTSPSSPDKLGPVFLR